MVMDDSLQAHVACGAESQVINMFIHQSAVLEVKVTQKEAGYGTYH